MQTRIAAYQALRQVDSGTALQQCISGMGRLDEAERIQMLGSLWHTERGNGKATDALQEAVAGDPSTRVREAWQALVRSGN